MELKEIIKQFAKEKGMTLKELAEKADMSSNGLHNKFNRQSITVKDLERLLTVLGKQITFIDIEETQKTGNREDKENKNAPERPL